MSEPWITFVFKVLWSGLPRSSVHTLHKTCAKALVQSATARVASGPTLHMSEPVITFIFTIVPFYPLTLFCCFTLLLFYRFTLLPRALGARTFYPFTVLPFCPARLFLGNTVAQRHAGSHHSIPLFGLCLVCVFVVAALPRHSFFYFILLVQDRRLTFPRPISRFFFAFFHCFFVLGLRPNYH